MPYLQLTIDCTKGVPEQYVAALEDAGALSVTFLDTRAQTDQEHAILEPAPGQTPLWEAVTLTALFSLETDALAVLVRLGEKAPQLAWEQAHFSHVADQVWERAWLDQFHPMHFGERTFIVPWTHPLPAMAKKTAQAAVLRLDPGLAFGSGTHPTTALCLEWLDALAVAGALHGQSILDFGSGSGILALAALKLGAARAVAMDIDPQALQATQQNAERNGIADRLEVIHPQHAPSRTFPLVVANILASTLDTMAETLVSSVAE